MIKILFWFVLILILLMIPTACVSKDALTFKVGEKLIYSVEKKFLNKTLVLGKATLELKRTTFIRGMECYHFIFDVKSDIRIGFEKDVTLKISVRNRVDSYSSVKDLFTYKIGKYIDEKYPGRKRKVEKTTIEIVDNTVLYSDGSKIEMHPWMGMRDNLTLIYWLRSVPNLENQDSISVISLAENPKNFTNFIL